MESQYSERCRIRHCGRCDRRGLVGAQRGSFGQHVLEGSRLRRTVIGYSASRQIHIHASAAVADDDPGKFFQGLGHYSFPSGEVAEVAGAVAPFVFEYGREHPAVYALEGSTIYDMVARVKTGSHWQSDVLVSAALGTAFGYSRATAIGRSLSGCSPEAHGSASNDSSDPVLGVQRRGILSGTECIGG
ncbi:MAG TPA: phosphatase PAP2 family protein [Casimicrobiaceae bacterium]|nr:phosphatase PAP2 family protein [Casimicrobiaceae bacterium]